MTEPIKLPPDLKKDDWRHLKEYGYAPGEYMGTCHRCGETPTMDKRAITCRPCAETMHADEQKRKQEPSAWIIDGDLESLMAEGRRAVLTERAELRAEVERLRADAERYRWLRDMNHWPACFGSHSAPEPVRGSDLDAAIDAALKETK